METILMNTEHSKKPTQKRTATTTTTTKKTKNKKKKERKKEKVFHLSQIEKYTTVVHKP